MANNYHLYICVARYQMLQEDISYVQVFYHLPITRNCLSIASTWVDFVLLICLLFGIVLCSLLLLFNLCFFVCLRPVSCAPFDVASGLFICLYSNFGFLYHTYNNHVHNKTMSPSSTLSFIFNFFQNLIPTSIFKHVYLQCILCPN